MNEEQKNIYIVCRNPAIKYKNYFMTFCVVAKSEAECYRIVLTSNDYNVQALISENELTENDLTVIAYSQIDLTKHTEIEEEIEFMYKQDANVKVNCLAKIISKCKGFALKDKNIRSGIIEYDTF